MNSYHLRFAEPRDVEDIQNIEVLAGQNFLTTPYPTIAADPPHDSVELIERIAAQQIIVICESDRSPVGFVLFRPMGDALYLEEIDILPAHAGQRLGASLIDETERVAQASGCTSLILSTFRDVPFNAPYYTKLGFHVVPDQTLTSYMRTLKAEHTAAGLDENRRVFMRRTF